MIRSVSESVFTRKPVERLLLGEKFGNMKQVQVIDR